jgi:hypothetical protein
MDCILDIYHVWLRIAINQPKIHHHIALCEQDETALKDSLSLLEGGR